MQHKEHRQTQQRTKTLNDTVNKHWYQDMQTTEGKYILSKQQLDPLQGQL